MIQTVQQTVATRFPRLCGKRVLVAASGGADSTALALALKELGCEIALAHIHHGIRGKEATTDAGFVRALAKKLKVPFFLGKFNVPAEAKKTGDSLEMAARRIRRDFLRATAKAEGFRLIATGHTADDQAETVLMRIVRGTSITGLAGIAYTSRQGGLTLVRPLRDVTRAQVVAYLEGCHQPWREDKSNAEDFAMRNRVRHEIFPLLEKRLNPAVRSALLRLADIAAAEDEVMSTLTKRATASEKLPLAIRRRLALAQLRQKGVAQEAISFETVEKYFNTMEQPSAEPESRFCGAKGEREVYSGARSASSERAKRTERQTILPYHGKPSKTFSMTWKNGDSPASSVRIPQAAIKLHIRTGRGFSRRTDEVCLSAAAVAGRDLVFRSWQAGDRIKPLGMTGSKKLSDIFTDLKVPRAERNSRLVVECGGEVVALAGWRVARGFAVEGPRKASLRIRILNASDR